MPRFSQNSDTASFKIGECIDKYYTIKLINQHKFTTMKYKYKHNIFKKWGPFKTKCPLWECIEFFVSQMRNGFQKKFPMVGID